MLQTTVLTPAEYVKQKLRVAKVTQADLTKQIDIETKKRQGKNEKGYSPSFISDVLNENRWVTNDFIERLCWVDKALNLNINRLYLYYLCGRFPPELVYMDEDEFDVAIEPFK
jgi:hypothetical protein